MASPAILTIQKLAKNYGSEEIFRDVTFQVAEREHVALVGVNGAGKSTVLRIIAGIEEQNGGEVVRASGLRVTYLPQEARFSSDNTVRQEAHLAFADAIRAGERMREIEQVLGDVSGDEMERLLEEYDRLLHHFELSGGYDMEHRAEAVLSGLGFTEDQFDHPVNQLSGGQKTRVALAKALLAEPDLLLLDEPTNHLDLEMLEWLEDFLRTWGGACLIVSHDRYFLDRVTTRTMEMAFGTLEDYPAPYSRFLDLRVERRARRLKEYEEQQEYIQRTEEFIRKYKAGQRAREARGRQTRLDRLERIDRPQDHQELNIRLSSNVRSGRTVLSTSPLTVGYPTSGEAPDGRVLIQAPELTIERGDRIGLIGPNGSGKTTLLRTLNGQLKALKGRIELGTGVTVGYYAQTHEQLPQGGTPLSVILAAQPIGEEGARNFLGRFLFSGDDVLKPVSGLSGGERSRLALGLLLLQRANFLVLDEPTNHLDVNAREALEEMLNEFDGTILFVSHDRFFIDRIATKIWSVEEGGVRQSLGNYTDLQRRQGRRADDARGGKAKTQQEDAAAPAEPAKPQEPRRSNRTEAALSKQLGQVEKDIARLEGRLNDVSDALAVASIDADVAALERLGIEYARLQDELEEAYARWETVSVELQEATPA